MATTTGGYHGFEIFEGSTELIKCLYCTGILRDAMELPCGHLVCETCLQSIDRQRNEMNKKCPSETCQTIFNMNEVQKSRYAERLVNNLTVFCLKREFGCEWTGTIADFVKIHEASCKMSKETYILEELLRNVKGLTTEINHLKAENQEIKAEHQAIKTELQQINEKGRALSTKDARSPQMITDEEVFHAKENLLVGGIERFLENDLHYSTAYTNYTEWYQFLKDLDDQSLNQGILPCKNHGLLKIRFLEKFEKVEWFSHSQGSAFMECRQQLQQQPLTNNKGFRSLVIDNRLYKKSSCPGVPNQLVEIRSTGDMKSKCIVSHCLINTRTLDDGWDHNNTKFAIILHPKDVSKSLEFTKMFFNYNSNIPIAEPQSSFTRIQPQPILPQQGKQPAPSLILNEWICENITEDYYGENHELIICMKKHPGACRVHCETKHRN